MNDKHRIRVGVIIIRDNQILTVRMHRERAEDIFVLPGGGVNPGEDIFKAAEREVEEETNLKIRIKKILYIKSLYDDKSSALEIILLGEITGGSLNKGFDPEHKRKNVLKEVKFFGLGQFKKLNFHPKQIKEILERDYKKGFGGECKYLGNFRYPER